MYVAFGQFLDRNSWVLRRKQGLTDDENMVLGYIQVAGNQGACTSSLLEIVLSNQVKVYGRNT